MLFFQKEKPNREIYQTAYWRAIHPLDRAHILLVAEGVKPMAYTEHTDIKSVKEYLAQELKIWVTEARGKRSWWPTETDICLPSRVYTICGLEKSFKFIQELWGSPNQAMYWDYEGKLLGYPECCRQEYVAPTYKERYNPWILKQFGRKPYSFKVEAVRRLLEGKTIPEEFLYCMPSQTPCSIGCRKSLKLLSRWKRILWKYDPAAAEAVKEFNQRYGFARYQAMAEKLRKNKFSSEMFRKGYVLTIK